MTYSRFNLMVWALRLTAAITMFQTLFFKFSASAESVYIFGKLGLEPWGRIGAGVLEGIASILLVIPRFSVYGALMGFVLMAGALVAHATKVGIVVMDDGGELFILALITLLSCAALILIFRKNLMQHPHGN